MTVGMLIESMSSSVAILEGKISGMTGGGIRQGVFLGSIRGSDYGGAIGEGVPRLLILLVL